MEEKYKRKMKKNTTIEEMQAEIAALKEASAKNMEKKDEEEVVCEQCGGDLQIVEDGILYCSHCKQYYEYDE